MSKRKEQERSKEELISFVAERIISGCQIGDAKNLLSLNDICEIAYISKEEWQKIRNQVEEYIGKRYQGAQLWTESRGEKEGECLEKFNIYIDDRPLSYHFIYLEETIELKR